MKDREHSRWKWICRRCLSDYWFWWQHQHEFLHFCSRCNRSLRLWQTCPHNWNRWSRLWR